MDVIRAGVLGFCGGVRRAVDMIEAAARDAGPIYTLHAIVHNEQVMARLQRTGVVLVSRLSEIPDGSTVALTAHGAPRPILAALQARGLRIVDATCPIVHDAQVTVAANARSKRFTIIYGDREHVEVQGLLSQAPMQAMASESIAELKIPAEGRLAIVGQTTKSPTSLQAFARDVRAQLEADVDLKVQDTTCAEPLARYQAAGELAARVDAVVVVGSQTSANTRNLYQVCAAQGRRAIFAASADAIDPADFEDLARVGLTAGASTPDGTIDAVESRLRQI